MDPSKEPSKDGLRKRSAVLWACNVHHFWGALSNGEDRPGKQAKYPIVGKFEGGNVTHLPGSRNNYYAFRGKPGNDRDELSGGARVPMQAKFILCACPYCRQNYEESCPYKADFGVWDDHVLKRVGGVASDGITVGTRNCGGESCACCLGVSHTQLPKAKEAKRKAVGNLTKGKIKKVMLLCDGCDSSWHIGCLPHQKSTVPLTEKWFCPACTQPCDKCNAEDVYSDALERLLRCSKCDKSMHMHCLNTPLKEEPENWRCGECISRRMVTRLMATGHNVCTFCHQDAEPSSKGCQKCSYCNKVWHTEEPCLDNSDLPEKGKEKNWRCPECPALYM